MSHQDQLDFVQDIESGIVTLIAQGTPVSQINQVTNASGRTLQEVSLFAERLLNHKQYDLLERLAEAFLKVGLAPKSITRALEAAPKSRAVPTLAKLGPAPLTLDRSIPTPVVERSRPQTAVSRSEPVAAAQGVNFPSAIAQVVSIIDCLPTFDRKLMVEGIYGIYGTAREI
jgi:hypothetical protein